MTELQHGEGRPADGHEATVMDAGEEYLSISVAEQTLGIPVRQVNDILDQRTMTWVPGAPAPVRGLINLRGHIVTAIDMRKRLATGTPLDDQEVMHVVVNSEEEEPYSLVVDNVTEIRTLDENRREPTPTTLDATWQAITDGVFRVEHENETILMLAADVPSILDFDAIRQGG
jgi:purine-binding chemotaxis protein CheW